MPIRAAHLADTSAWSKARNDPELAEAFDDAARQGFIVTCDLIALELLRSAQNHDRFDRQAGLLASLDSFPIVSARSTGRGRCRQRSPPTVSIAASSPRNW